MKKVKSTNKKNLKTSYLFLEKSGIDIIMEIAQFTDRDRTIKDYKEMTNLHVEPMWIEKSLITAIIKQRVLFNDGI